MSGAVDGRDATTSESSAPLQAQAQDSSTATGEHVTATQDSASHQGTAAASPQSARPASYPEQPSIEDDVKQLVGSVSSWWSGFSKRSQEQLNQARAQIDAQGGLMSMAKREAQRFEAQLTEAQKAAREDVTAGARGEGDDRKKAAIDIDGLTATGSYTPPVVLDGKGKGRSTEGDDGFEVDRLEERLEEQRRSRQSTRDGADPATGDEQRKGESLFDADALGGIIDKQAVDEAVTAARHNAQTAMSSVQAFWSKLQADPRVNSVQSSVAQTLQNIKVPRTSGEQAREGGERDAATQASTLPDLTKQFQGAFPHLDWKESQSMAKRYFEASQSAAQSWGKEMSHLMSDLVKIVPPEEKVQDVQGNQTAAGDVKAAAEPARTRSSPRAPLDTLKSAAETDDDDFFDWDKEVEPQTPSAASVIEAPTSAEARTSPADTTSTPAKDAGATSANPASAKPASKLSSVPAKADEDDDSDWE